jgi:cardiolipin synthase
MTRRGSKRAGPRPQGPRGALLRFLNFRDGNRARFHPDGNAALDALERLIADSKEELLLASYTIAADRVGLRIEEKLVEAAARGVRVRVVVDGIGSLETAHNPLPRLRAAGGWVEVYRPIGPWRRNWGLWNRDHRKIFVADGRAGLIGGMNLAEPYVRPPAEGGMIDRVLELEGPAAFDLARLFDRTWRALTDEPMRRREIPPPDPRGNARIAIEGNSRILDRHRIGKAYREAIRGARETIDLENPYFLPGAGLRRNFRNAMRRGVAVRIVLPERTDSTPVDLASRAIWSRIKQAGVDLRIDPAFVHSKIAVFDRRQTIIGSFNLDRRSLFHNLEAVAFVESEEIAAAASAVIDADAARAHPLDLAVWRRRPRLEKWLQHAMFNLRALL